MTIKEGAGHDTRERLLASAVELFAEKGFRGTTVKEICTDAGANIAAVNYYFGSKEKLYAEAWRKAFQDSLEAHPSGGGVPAGAPAEERLRGYVRSLIQRVADEKSREFLIAHKEMANPTRLLEQVRRKCVGPLRGQMTALVRELLGPDAAEENVRFCQMSIVSQCLHPVRHRRHHGRTTRENGPALIQDVEAYAEHVVRFSLAGVRATRDYPGGGAARTRKRRNANRGDDR